METKESSARPIPDESRTRAALLELIRLLAREVAVRLKRQIVGKPDQPARGLDTGPLSIPIDPARAGDGANTPIAITIEAPPTSQ